MPKRKRKYPYGIRYRKRCSIYEPQNPWREFWRYPTRAKRDDTLVVLAKTPSDPNEYVPFDDEKRKRKKKT